MNKESKGMLIGLMGIIVLSLTLPISKIAVVTFNPYFLTFGRAFLAGMVALAYLLYIQAPIPSKSTFLKIIVISLGVVIGFPLFTTLAMRDGSSSHGAVILGVMPLVTAVIGAIRFRERPSAGFWLISILGTGLVIIYALLKSTGSLTYVDGLLILGGVCACLGYVEGGELSRKINARIVISWALIISLPISIGLTYFTFDTIYWQSDAIAWTSFIYLSLCPMFLGFFLWYEGLAIGGIARVSQVQLIQPFCTLLASNIILGEALTTMNIIFALLVISTVVLSKKMLIRRC